MINRFKITVAAAALIAGTGFANAQGTGGMGREAPSGGSTMQQGAPSSDRGNSAGQMNRDAAEPGMKSTQSDEKSPAGRNQRADEKMQGQKSKGVTSETDNTTKAGKDMKAEGREDRNGNMNQRADEKMQGQKSKGVTSETDNTTKAGKDMKAEGREDRNGNMNTDSKGASGSKSQTVGQAGAGAKLSTEQRTKITTVIRGQHVQPVTNVNFAVSVGTRVPRDVSFHPLPAEVVTIYPEWRGYNFILVGDRIVVIDPGTFEIVAVIDA
jgi:Protein of unknown function (DUF1236)